MLSINTNLSSLIAQRSLKISSNKLNTAIERMSTGFKINNSKDNAANYSISTNMSTQISALDIAEDNTCMGVDLLTTADSTLGLISDKLQRLRTLAVQSSNGTYGDKSKQAINQEANALINEMQRLHATTEYNGKKILGDDNPQGGFVNNSSNTSVTLTPRSTASFKALGEIEDATVALADGTYSISSAEELAQLAEMTNAGLISEGDEFVLANDIDLIDYTSGEGWVPIGTSSNKFSGTFDGNGHTIKNLYINRPSTNMQGLFGDSTGILKNIHIIDASVSGNIGVGILTGVQRGNIILNCSTTGVIKISNYSAGGIVGQFFGEIKNCNSKVKFESLTDGIKQIGGLVGSCAGGDAKICRCYTNSNIKSSDISGGLIGLITSITSAEILNSYAYTEIVTKNTKTSTSSIGGFVGGSSAKNLTISNCSSTGSIIGENSATTHGVIGGFLGGSDLSSTESLNITNSYSTVDISLEGGTKCKNIAGFIGQLALADSGIADITNCYSTGDIIATSPDINTLGGFIGYSGLDSGSCSIKITNSYSTGKMTLNSPKIVNAGGFIGLIKSSNSHILNNYTLTDMHIEGGTDTFHGIGGFLGDILQTGTTVNIENSYNKNKITTDLAAGVTNTIGGFFGDISEAGASLNIKNSYMLAEKDSDIVSIWGSRVTGTTFDIKNSYYNKEFENTGLNLFSDETGNAIDQDLNAQVKTCATDNPFKFYFNQQTGLQVGTASGKDSRISVDTTCSLNYMNILRNIGLQEDDYLSRIDELLAEINEKQVHIGAGNNRLLSAIEEITIRRENLVSSRSTLRDADIADVSSSYIQQQILQQASATLLSTANQSASIALSLI